MNQEIAGVQAGFRKGRETKLPTSNIEKAKKFQENIYFGFIDYAKAFDCVDHNKFSPCGKFWKGWEYQTTLPVSWETCILVKKQQLEFYMEQLTGSN